MLQYRMCQYLHQHSYRQCFSPFAANMQYVISFKSVFLPCSIAHFHIDHCKTHKVLFNGFYHFFLFLFAACIQTKQISRSMKKQNMRRKTNTFVFLLLFSVKMEKKASLAKLCKKSIEFYLLSKWVYVERAFSAKCSYSLSDNV